MFAFLMLTIAKTLKFLIFFYLFFNVFLSIAQTNEEVPLNNIVQHDSTKPISSVLINKKGEEFTRIIGSIDFQDKKFLKWLSNYD